MLFKEELLRSLLIGRLIAMGLLLGSCASSEQQQGYDEMSSYEGETDEAASDAAPNADSATGAAEEENEDEALEALTDSTDDVDEIAEEMIEEFAAQGDEEANYGSEEGAGSMSATPAASGNETVGMSPPGSAPINDSTATGRESGMVIRYVQVDSATVRSGPDVGSAQVATLARGEHLLVTITGDWAVTKDGTYIALQDLSEKAISRVKLAGAWN